MIAKTSSGASFHALGRYLAVGRGGTEADRVAWSASRNLPVDDPRLAATIMRATAQQNRRVEKPVYHLSISFDPRDPVTRDTMERVVDRTLQRLGLAEHQAILVAHHDRAHPHVHVMVNRVHPETGRAWARWQDRPIIEQVLRECEREFGLRRVRGRLADEPHMERPDRTAQQGYGSGERRKRARGEPLLVDRVRAQAEGLRGAISWRTLEVTLAEHGWHLARRGQGLVIGDGRHYVKASRVDRDFSLFRLERKFGIVYVDGAKDPMLPPCVASAAYAARTLHDFDTRVATAYMSRMSAAEAKAIVERLDRLAQQKRTTSRAFSEALIPVYRDIRAARRAFEAAVTVEGANVAAARLRTTPEQFGVLRTETRLRGLLRRTVADDTVARHAAIKAADVGRQALEAARQAPTQAMRRATREAATGASRRQRTIGQRLHVLGPRAAAEATLRQVMRTLLPSEVRLLATVLTKPQHALAMQVRSAVKDLVLGRDGMER